ncbi:uncharacterized protein LOC123917173 [Trifolium pratense]|uniref:uncharacterized protein LOC123917173 n=1 Tax=Trifolium pratense TaxID=57577 RepID=UPI001E697C05|nr:uncharacterized protein LOC123917173 [Trifolium pratense]
MDDDNKTIIESRQELMVSPTSGQNQTLRTAYFLTPPCIKDSHFLPTHFTIPSQITTKLPLEVRYNGWRNPHEEWIKWVKKLQPKFESLWLKTGIYHAIKASEYEIKRDDELILELANRWCSKTNTFVFPWGETTLTLEDTKVCFGFSVLGCSVTTPIMNSEQKEAEEELFEARRMFNSSRGKKVNQSAWIKHFMKGESKVEHEAFLVYWLSRFVFPADSYDTILKSVFPIAINLAYGTRIALAPAVLASVYRDLSLLNSIIKNNATITMKSLRVTICAPFQLVQVWALERFLGLRHGLPNVARWGGKKMMKNKNLKKDLDCAGFRDEFLWKPYENSPCIEVYNEKDMWKCDNPCLDEELASFSRCLMVCELVGMGCKEKYFPHRVAMQFGMDQDIPGEVSVCKNDPWMSDSEPLALVDFDLCIELCFRLPGVTSRYYDWWKKSKSSPGGDNNTMKVEESYDLPPPPGFTSKFERNQMDNNTMKVEELYDIPPPPGFTSKYERNQTEGSDKKDNFVVYELSSSDDEVVANGKGLSSAEFDEFLLSFVGDEAEMNSLFCDRNDENGESFSPFTLDMANDLENRIQKLEKVADKVKETRFGSKG